MRILPLLMTRGEIISLDASTNRANAIAPELSVFSYTDYRKFLNDFYLKKKASNPSYSMSTFIRRAGLGRNSRGYLKMVIEGRRNLTPHSLRRFVEAISLEPRDALYFENLVFFNQSKNPKDQEFYFERLSVSAQGHETAQFELLKSQYRYHSNWYIVAIRELVGLEEFQEDPQWIVNHLRGKISKKEALDAIASLITLGLLKRNKSGRLVQTQPLVKRTGGVFNETVQRFHIEMMERAKESLTEDPYLERNASSVTLSCSKDCLSDIVTRIDGFRDKVTQEFGLDSRTADCVIQINFQVCQLTPINRARESSGNKNVPREHIRRSKKDE